MKCIKFYRKNGGHVVRLPDDEAHELVKSGVAMYCPKHWWKAALKIEPLSRTEGVSP